MKRLIIAITLLTVILSMLTSCTKSENTNESAVSEDNASASASAHESIEASASENPAESYEDMFEHGNYSYKRLSGNVYSAYYEPDGFRLWRTDRELGSFFRGSYQGGIEAISENRFLAHGKTSNSTFSISIIDENGEEITKLTEVCGFENKDGYILISYPSKDSRFSNTRTVILDTDGKGSGECYYELLSETVPEGKDCELLGLRDTRIYEIAIENGKATEKEIKPLLETKQTIYDTEVTIRKYEPLLTESKMFSGGYWVYFDGGYDYLGSSVSRKYTSEEPIFTNGLLLLKYQTEPDVYFARNMLDPTQEPTLLLSLQCKAESDYIIARDGGFLPDPWIIIDKNGNRVYQEELSEAVNENGETYIVQLRSIEFDNESENPNAIIITHNDGKTEKTTIEKLISER
ncbi:MAG: hypothetical protein J6R45_03640 [Clostridia bacterium]|nr:hypothetical protein [Clostridia bacterium]